jgi:hypothetical protein
VCEPSGAGPGGWPDVRVMLDDPELARRSPGEEFALTYVRMGDEAAVELRAAITELFPPSRRRPRHTVRNLLRHAVVAVDEVTFARETPAPGGGEPAGFAGTPEASFHVGVASTRVQTIPASVRVPDEVLADPAALAGFVDFRLLPRLGTVENDVLLNGDGNDGILGLRRTPGLRNAEPHATVARTLLAAAAQCEWHGGSADGIVVHPDDWWPLLGESDLLARLAGAGVRVSRTRMVPAGSALVGDFSAGATLLDQRRSAIRLARPDERPGPGRWLVAAVREGLAVHLPGHFVVAGLPQ